MKMLTCAATRRRLQAYHDEELALGDQIAVAAHLEWCDACGEILTDMRELRDALRVSLPGRFALSEEFDLQEAVVSRINAEDRLSFAAWLRESFEDMHFVYAGASAMAAALVCMVVTLGMMRFATTEAPDSPAAMVKLLSSSRAGSWPGSNLNPVIVTPLVSVPRALDEPVWLTVGGGNDSELMLSAIVTREGRVGNLEVLNAWGNPLPAGSPGGQEYAVESLLDVASRARFEPASFAGSPIAVNMVWIVAHTTVRASKDPLDPALLRPGKKSASTASRADVRV